MKASDLFDISGRTALVTGASSGLGWRFAEVLAANGANVALGARRVEQLKSLEDRITAQGGKAMSVAMDVTDEASVAAAFDAAEAAFGTVSICVNNAGIAIQKPILDLDYSEWRKVVDTDLDGVFRVGKEAGGRMIEAGVTGSIINIASILGFGAQKTLAPYAVSKAGVIQLTRVMALEWATKGVRVNGIAPGYVITEINRDFFETSKGEEMIATVPMRRIGQPEDLDGVVLLLASDASAFMTGETVVIDGGHLQRL